MKGPKAPVERKQMQNTQREVSKLICCLFFNFYKKIEENRRKTKKFCTKQKNLHKKQFKLGPSNEPAIRIVRIRFSIQLNDFRIRTCLCRPIGLRQSILAAPYIPGQGPVAITVCPILPRTNRRNRFAVLKKLMQLIPRTKRTTKNFKYKH